MLDQQPHHTCLMITVPREINGPVNKLILKYCMDIKVAHLFQDDNF